MSGDVLTKERVGPYTSLDHKIDVAEEKIRNIKNSNLPESEKKNLLKIQDTKINEVCSSIRWL